MNFLNDFYNNKKMELCFIIAGGKHFFHVLLFMFL